MASALRCVPTTEADSGGLTSPTTLTDAEGKYEITQLAAGIHTIIFEGTGYQTLTITNWEVKVGTVSTLNVELSPNP